jgi:hypothetical protein
MTTKNQMFSLYAIQCFFFKNVLFFELKVKNEK